MRHLRGGAARRCRRGATARALALAFPVLLSVVFFSSRSTAAAAASSPPAAAPGNASSSSSSSPSTSSPGPFDSRARTVACSPTSYNGTLLGDDSCLVQPGRAWLGGAAAGVAVVSAPSESDCCSQCRARQAPNARSPPETACVFTYCDVGPGLFVSGKTCDDGLGGSMRDGECRTALVPLPLSGSAPLLGGPASGAAASASASAGVISGTPAASFLLPLKAAAPPRGYRAVGPVRLPSGGGGAASSSSSSFDGPGCDFSTDELLRRSVARAECVSNASSVAAAARLCSGQRGCTGVSWYPTNGIPILRAYSARGGGGFADVGNPAFGAVAPGEPAPASSSLAVFKFGALDKRCVTPSPYSFLFVQEDAPRPAGLANSPFEAQEEAMGAARRRRVAGLAAGVSAAVAAVAAAVAALVFFLLRGAKRRRRGGGEAEVEGGKGLRDDRSVGGGSEGLGSGLGSGLGGGGGSGSGFGGPSLFASSVTPRGAALLSKQSSLERMVRGAASKRAKMRALAEGSRENRGASGGDNGSGGGLGLAGDGNLSDGSDEDPLEDWELPLTEIEILQRPDGSGDWLLGEGASGNVYRGRLSGLGGQDVAVKVFLDQSDGKDEDGRDDADAEASSKRRHDALRREVVILKSLRDQNVVRFVGANVGRGSTVLVTEYCPRGDLYRALARDGGRDGGGGGGRRFTWTPSYVRAARVAGAGGGGGGEEARRRPGTGLNWSVAADVCRGLAYLHGRGLVHRDVKSPNVLLGEQFRALVADVGLARVLHDDGGDGDDDRGGGGDDRGGGGGGQVGSGGGASAAATSSSGTFAWAAPELLLGRRVSEAGDIFSLGVVLWELSTGEPPPPNRRLRALEVPGEAPAGVRDLIDRCLEEEPSRRPSARELLEFFAAGIARLDAEAGVRVLASAGPSVGGSVGDTLARVSRASSAAASAGDGDDAFALPPRRSFRPEEGDAAPSRREPPVPEEGEGGA